jgi:hypothetical protein
MSQDACIAGEPITGAEVVLGGRPEVADEAGELSWLAFALHEQHAVELQRSGIVEVVGAGERAERPCGRRGGARPAMCEGVECPVVALQGDGALAR